MRALLIFAVAAAFVIFECESLKCYNCVGPSNCLHLKKGETEEVTCAAGEWCQRSFRKANDPDSEPQRGDYFKTVGGIVMERLCNTKANCYSKQKKNSKLMETKCCNMNLCNI